MNKFFNIISIKYTYNEKEGDLQWGEMEVTVDHISPRKEREVLTFETWNNSPSQCGYFRLDEELRSRPTLLKAIEAFPNKEFKVIDK